MNKIIIVTGASSGFGLMAAQSLARAGHTVFAGMRASTGLLRRMGLEDLLSSSHELPSGRI
jgi:NAD(P)-dependent dehydrogenase (short-subunit alcohol dehydrogenase family)